MSAGIVANLLVAGVLAIAAILNATSPALYHRSVQEDEILEWTTFWAFALAAVFYAISTRRAARTTPPWPWFLAGLSLFCGFVAMEEISWGQRLLAYRPPAYFLEHNFQQELNLHNVVETDLRKAAFLVVVLGYGAVLPLLYALAPVRRFGERLGVVAPHWLVAPAFIATGVFYSIYPWSHSGEWAEAMLGLGLLCIALARTGRGGVGWLVGAGLATVFLGLVTTRVWWLATGDDPTRVATAEIELRALRQDLSAARTRTRCGLHKRVYSMVRKYDQDHLNEGAFAALVDQGLPEERARFFLDPWNSPYWIRHECTRKRDRRAIFVYSFGPDRKRDSTDWEFVEDDLGAWISRPRASASD